MKKKQLDKLLKKSGYIIGSGAKHDYARKPREIKKITIPRHNEISDRLADLILKEAGIKQGK